MSEHSRIRAERTTRGFEHGWTAFVAGVGSSQQYASLAELREALASPHYNWLVYLPSGEHRQWGPIPPNEIEAADMSSSGTTCRSPMGPQRIGGAS